MPWSCLLPQRQPLLQHMVQDIIIDTLEVENATAFSMERLGSQPATEGGWPRKILVKLLSRQQAMATLKPAKRLKDVSILRKIAGEHLIGIDRNVSGAELRHRSAVWSEFKAAKAAGKNCRWQMGFRLFVEGSEVLLKGSP